MSNADCRWISLVLVWLLQKRLWWHVGGEGFLGNRCRGELLAPERTDKMVAWKNG